MSPAEVDYLASAHYKNYKERWEMLRLSNHAVIAAQSSKPVKAEDIMKFPWDKSAIVKAKPLTKDEISATRDRIKKKFNI